MNASDTNDAKQAELVASDTEKPPKKARRTSKVKELAEQVEKLKSELADLKDKYVRTVAEFENFKKRRTKEMSEIVDRATEQFWRELLPIIDDFERSLNTEAKRKSYKSLHQGIDLIYQKLTATLKRHGIEPINSVGEQFNPELHDAVMQVHDQQQPSNIVISEVLKGYRLRDKVLRHAQVVVNK